MAEPIPTGIGRPVPWRLLLGAAVVTALVRLPAALRRSQLSFDDGVYGASTMAMRDGAAPFLDVFSGQGPLYFPLLRVVDVVGLETTWAPRLLGVAAAAVLVVVGGLLAGRRSAAGPLATAMGLVATSGLLYRTTTAIEADSVAAALAAVAVLIAVRRGPPWALGLAVAAALSVKSLLVVPAAVAAGVVYVVALGWRPAARAAAVTAAVGLALAAPWGIGRVWDQSVDFHLDARHGFPVGANADHLWETLWRSERLLVVAVVVALAGSALGRVGRKGDAAEDAEDADAGGRIVALAAWLWLLGTVGVLAIHSPLFGHHVTVLVAPLAVLVARARPWWPALAVAAVLLLPGHLDRIGWTVDRSPPAGQARAIDDLRRLVPEGRAVITDGPGVAWWAGREQVPWLIDLSLVRIDTDRVDRVDVERAAAGPDVCAVLVWSGRLADLGPFDLPGYEVAARYGLRQELWVRTACASVPPADDGGG